LLSLAKQILAISLVLFFAGTSSAQNDELNIRKFRIFKDLAIHFQAGNLDTSRMYLDSCFLTAQKISNRYYLADAYQLRSRDFYLRAYPDSALIYSDKAIAIFQDFPDSTAHFIAEYNKGNIFLDLGEYIQALVQFKKGLNIIDDNFEAFITKDQDVVNMNRAYCYFSMGLVYDHLEDFPKSLQNFQKGLKISYKVHSEESDIFQAVSLGNIGLAHYQNGNYELAESFAIAGMDEKKRLGYENTSGYNYQVMARSAYGRKKYSLALKYLELSDKFFVEIQNNLELNINQLWRAKCYYAQADYDRALELLLPLENEFSVSTSRRSLIELYELISEVYTAMGEHKKANEYLRINGLLQDDIALKTSKDAVEELLAFIEEEEKRVDDKLDHFKTIQEKEQLQDQVKVQNEKQALVYSIYLVSIFCLVVIIIVIARGNRRNKRINQELSNSIDEKQILFKEVHHRVKNNFQIISSLLNLQQGIEENAHAKKVLVDAQGRIQSMSLVHEMLYRRNEVKQIDFRTYAEELVSSIIRSYSSEKVKVDSVITCSDESFDLELAVPLGLMLNEAVTNSVKYAFTGKSTGKIDISLEQQAGDHYLLVIKDDGIGIPSAIINGDKETLGIELISILSAQLGGSVKFLNGQGTEVRILFSAAD
jgi:two-component system, sensor histidine kinase PdtaS